MSDNPFMQEYLDRKRKALMAFPSGVPYVDDCIGKIRPCDLVILTAKTGIGKTEILATIAMSAAAAGKKVAFFALEAEQLEIHRRVSYRKFAQKFFEKRGEYPKEMRLDYTSWLLDEYDHMEELNLSVAAEMLSETEGIQFYNPNIARFTKEDFTSVYEEYVKEADLIILDHIHYITRKERVNEYDHIQDMVFTLKDLINRHEVPLVAAAHIRKEERGAKTILPTLDEIHGASDIAKVANHIFSFGPAYSLPCKDNPKNTVKPPVGSTLCRLLKTRTGRSGADRYAALMRFNLETKTYDPEYVPYHTDKSCEHLYPMKYQEFEHWMSAARESKA